MLVSQSQARILETDGVFSLLPRFLNDSSISLWRFLNVPLKKIISEQWSLNIWLSGYTNICSEHK